MKKIVSSSFDVLTGAEILIIIILEIMPKFMATEAIKA